MKLTLAIIILSAINCVAQSVYLPSGTSGIGNSTNSNVGIGTSSPADQFEIVSTNRKVGFNTLISGVANGGVLSLSRADGSKTFYAGTSNATESDVVLFGQGGSAEMRLVSAGSSSAGFGFYTNTTLATAFGNRSSLPTPAVKIAGNGNVGIGTANPVASAKLNVDAGLAGTQIMLGTTQSANRTALWIHSDGNQGKSLLQSWWTGVSPGTLALNPSGGKVGVGTNAPERNFHVDGGVTGTSMMLGSTSAASRSSLWLGCDGENGRTSIQSWNHGVNHGVLVLNPAGGNVGVGTNEPDEKLTVKGKIHTSEVRVDLEPEVVPDYVFEKNYNLLPLSEVESYIKANKHLPEVPSAKEMEAEGMNLKEMNLLLLKKVEELTLHLIEMKNEIDQLKRKK